MNTKNPTPVNETAPSPVENPIDPRGLRLLKHPYFAAPADLPPSTRKWGELAREFAAQAVKYQESEGRWEGTTPQGREIIRKKLFTLKRAVVAEAVKNPLDVLRKILPDYLALVSARKTSPADWQRCLDAAVDVLVRDRRTEGCLAIQEGLAAAYPKDSRVPQGGPQDEALDCWEALAAELTRRLKGLVGDSQPSWSRTTPGK